MYLNKLFEGHNKMPHFRQYFNFCLVILIYSTFESGGDVKSYRKEKDVNRYTKE